MTGPGTRTSVLDNVVWEAIAGPNAALAERLGKAGRYHRDVAPFAGIADATDPGCWRDLAALIGPGHRAMLFSPPVTPPEGWTVEFTIPGVQMVANDVVGERTGLELVRLGAGDVPEILELIAATRPGPFSERTIELGAYFGRRSDGKLVAMAGERMSCPGYTEVSAVCTAADHRGKGLGAALTLAVLDHVRARGDEAFLHAAADNTTAIRLYENLGFTLRREVEGVVVKPPGRD